MVRLSALSFTLATASVLVPGVLSQVPACATTCATNAASSTSCTATDTTCLCASAAFASNAQTCVETTCSSTDAAAAIDYFENLCGSSSIQSSSTLPTTTGTTPTTTSPSSTRSPTSPTTSTTTSSSSKPNHASRDQPAGVFGAGLALALALFA